MRTSYKSFANRMAALEALEQQAEVQALIDNEVPGVATVEAMEDDEALWNAVLAMRRYSLHVDLRFSRLALSLSHYRDDRWLAFFEALIDRVQPLLDAMEKPIIFLFPWEIAHAIRAIDAGLCSLSHGGYDNSRGMRVDCDYRLNMRFDYLSGAADEAQREAYREVQQTCDAVVRAVDLANRQLHYPQPRDFSKPEMTTLAEWRAWLVSVGGQSDATRS